MGGDETVSLLLNRGADAKMRNREGLAAIDLAVDKQLSDTALLLLDHSSTTGDSGRTLIGRVCQFGLNKVLKKLIELLDSDEVMTLLEVGFEMACEFGQDETMDILLRTGKIRKEVCKECLKWGIESDRVDCVKLLLEHVDIVEESEVETAIERKNNEIIDIIKTRSDSVTLREKGTEKCREQIEKVRQYLVGNKVVADSSNFDIFKSAVKLCDKDDKLEIVKLVECLRVPTVHLPPDYDNCEENCGQKVQCQCLRETLLILKDLMVKVGEINPLFKGATTKPAGSLVETTRIGQPDEMDMQNILDEGMKKLLFYDTDSQSVKVRGKLPKGHRLEPYITGDSKTVDVKKIFLEFLVALYKASTDYVIPPHCTTSRYSLVLSNYKPCTDTEQCQHLYKDDPCVNVEQDPAVFQRAKHNSPWIARTKVGDF